MSWQRVESASRDAKLDQGLEARIADPAWFLARQWQTGEFKGDDAANPLLVSMTARSVGIDDVVIGDGSRINLSDVDMPLEPLIERESVRSGPARALVAAELGWMLTRTLRRSGAPSALLDAIRDAYPMPRPVGNDDARMLDPLGFRRLTLLAAASVNGTTLESALADDPNAIEPLIAAAGLDSVVADRLRNVVRAWSATVADVFGEPVRQSAWDDERLEYRFRLSSSGPSGDPIELRADGYTGGRLDWYAYDAVDGGRADSEPGEATVRHVEVLPAPLRFAGMPAARFWEMEDGTVNFGHIQSAQEDLARVAVATYAVVHGDDWCVVPLRLPLGTLTQIVDLTVLDDFGRLSHLRSTAVVDGGGDQRAFRFFELTGDRSAVKHQTPLLFLPPTVETTDAARPLEDVRLLRDEAANLAWAVEERIESAAGRPVDLGARIARPRYPDDVVIPDDAWQFTLATPVPSNWIPMVPIRLIDDGDDPELVFGEVMFQRGRVPVEGGGSRGARGRVLTPERRLLLHEEEVPREGVRVVRRFQSARDAQGRLHTWVGRRKGPGRGAGESGLTFDHLDTTIGNTVD